MFGHDFSHQTMRRYVTLFGTLFNDIVIDRIASDGTITGQIKVPLSYGPKEKVLARLDQDPQLNRAQAITLPRMTFEISGMRYDQVRKLPTVGRTKVSSNTGSTSYQYNPVPYNIDFQLSIIVKNTEDGMRIMEQIVPFFTPMWTATVVLVPEMDNEERDIPVILNSVTLQDDYGTGAIDQRRSQIWTLGFTMKGYLFGPVVQSGLITLANVNFFAPTTNTAAEGIGNTTVSETITVVPGQDANGAATTNASITVSRNSVDSNQAYDYIVTITGNTGGT